MTSADEYCFILNQLQGQEFGLGGYLSPVHFVTPIFFPFGPLTVQQKGIWGTAVELATTNLINCNIIRFQMM